MSDRTMLLELLDAWEKFADELDLDVDFVWGTADNAGPQFARLAESIRSKLEAQEKAEAEDYLQNHGGSV